MVRAQVGTEPAVPAEARAGQAPPSNATQARALFNEGAQLAQRGQWAEARARFLDSAALVPHAVTAYNVGYCERALGHDALARKWLDEALAAGLPDEVAPFARAYLAEIDTRMARVEVHVSSAQAAIAVDGSPLAAATSSGGLPLSLANVRAPGPPEPVPAVRFALVLEPGEHRFVLALPGQPELAHVYSFASGAAQLELEPAQPEAAERASSAVVPAAEPLPAPPEPRPNPLQVQLAPEPHRTPAYVAFGVALTGIAVGTVAGAMALAQASELERDCPHDACAGTAARDLDHAGTVADVSTAAFVVGGVAAVTGVVLWLAGPREREREPRAARGLWPRF
jgi:hypothetical protein